MSCSMGANCALITKKLTITPLPLPFGTLIHCTIGTSVRIVTAQQKSPVVLVEPIDSSRELVTIHDWRGGSGSTPGDELCAI